MYEAIFSDEFKEQLSRLKKRDKVMYERIEKKIRNILTEPAHLKHLGNVLKGGQRVHLGHFVLSLEDGKWNTQSQKIHKGKTIL